MCTTCYIVYVELDVQGLLRWNTGTLLFSCCVQEEFRTTWPSALPQRTLDCLSAAPVSLFLSVCHSSRPFKIALTEDQHVFFFLRLPQFLCTESRITCSPPVPLCCLPFCCLPLESTRTSVTRAAYMHALWRVKHDFTLCTLLFLTLEQDFVCTIKLHKLYILRPIFWFCGLGTFYFINIRQKTICFVKVNHLVLVPKAYQT